jgi:hypothetical protein
MRFSEIRVGDFYIFIKDVPNNGNSYYIEEGTERYVVGIGKGTRIRCDSITHPGNWGNKVTLHTIIKCNKVAMSAYGNQVLAHEGMKIKVLNHQNLTKDNETDVVQATDDRTTRAKKLRKIVESISEEIVKLETSIVELTKKNDINKKALEELERFDSDEAEFANTLAKVFKSGGDEQEILKALLDLTGGSIVRNVIQKKADDMQKKITETEKEIAEATKTSKLLEF